MLDLGLDGCRVGQATPSQWALPGGHDGKVLLMLPGEKEPGTKVEFVSL